MRKLIIAMLDDHIIYILEYNLWSIKSNGPENRKLKFRAHLIKVNAHLQ